MHTRPDKQVKRPIALLQVATGVLTLTRLRPVNQASSKRCSCHGFRVSTPQDEEATWQGLLLAVCGRGRKATNTGRVCAWGAAGIRPDTRIILEFISAAVSTSTWQCHFAKLCTAGLGQNVALRIVIYRVTRAKDYSDKADGCRIIRVICSCALVTTRNLHTVSCLTIGPLVYAAFCRDTSSFPRACNQLCVRVITALGSVSQPCGFLPGQLCDIRNLGLVNPGTTTGLP